MPVANDAISTVAFGTRSNTSLSVPSGTGGKFLFILFMGNDPTDIAATAPTGFNPISGFAGGLLAQRQGSNGGATTTMNVYVWEKDDAGDAGSFTTTHASTGTAAYVARYSGAAAGVATDNPIAVTGNGSTTAGSPVDLVAPTVTTVVDGSMVIDQFCTWDGSAATSPPAGTTPTFTERFESFGNAFYVCDGPLTPAGATGTKTPSTQCSQNGWIANQIVLEAAGAGEIRTTAKFKDKSCFRPAPFRPGFGR